MHAQSGEMGSKSCEIAKIMSSRINSLVRVKRGSVIRAEIDGRRHLYLDPAELRFRLHQLTIQLPDRRSPITTS